MYHLQLSPSPLAPARVSRRRHVTNPIMAVCATWFDTNGITAGTTPDFGHVVKPTVTGSLGEST